MLQARLLIPGDQTVLAEAAGPAELFLSDEYVKVSAEVVGGKEAVKKLELPWGFESRGKGRRVLEEMNGVGGGEL